MTFYLAMLNSILSPINCSIRDSEPIAVLYYVKYIKHGCEIHQKYGAESYIYEKSC